MNGARVDVGVSAGDDRVGRAVQHKGAIRRSLAAPSMSSPA